MPNILNSTIVNSAYDTSGNGGRKIVTLSNGWLVASLKDATGGQTYFYLSKDNSQTWSQLCYLSTGFSDRALCSKGNIVYAVMATTTEIKFFKIDATTQTNIDISSTAVNLDTNQQQPIGNCSLIMNSQGTELHACWSSINSTYPNDYNIRYAKSTINSDDSVTLGTVEQVTIQTGVGIGHYNPNIVLNNDGVPLILIRYVTSTMNTIAIFSKKGGSWNTTYNHIYGYSTNNSYALTSPSAVFIPKSINGLQNGRVYAVWNGRDSTDTVYFNIQYAYSDDGGVTWSTMQKLTNGNTVNRQNPSITANKNGKLFITYEDNGIIKRLESVDKGITWSSPITVGTGTNPSALSDLSLNVITPLTIYKGNSSVLFSGDWITTQISGIDSNLGKVTTVSKSYSISIDDGSTTLPVTEKLDGNILNSYTATIGNTYTIDLSSIWKTLSYDKHTLTIECNGEIRKYTFTKVYGEEAKIGDLITALQIVDGINQKENLKSALVNKGVSISDTDSMADMISKLNGMQSKRWASGNVSSQSGTISVNLTFAPSILFAIATGGSTGGWAKVWINNQWYRFDNYSTDFWSNYTTKPTTTTLLLNTNILSAGYGFSWLALE